MKVAYELSGVFSQNRRLTEPSRRSRLSTAQVRLKVGHEQSGRNALTGNIANDEAEAIGASGQEIVVVSSDLSRLQAPPCVVKSVESRQALREEVGLHLSRYLQLLSNTALGLSLFGEGAALRFNRLGQFIEAYQRKRVAIDVLETSEDAA